MSVDRPAMAPYGLIFEGMGKNRVQGWSGPWPPPERIWAASGSDTGETVFFDPEAVSMDARMNAELASTITIRRFTRRSCSEIPPGTSEHLWPCAQYVEEGFVYDGGHLEREP